MTKGICRYTVIGLGLVWMLLTSTSVFANNRFYRLEIGVQAGVGYYMGELAEYAFMSAGETYGFQFRCKIDERWALQFKGQRQRVINDLTEDNEWGIGAGKYQTPMWHFDLTGEYNFFHFGLDEHDVRMHPITPFVFLGVGLTAHNVLASNKDDYPLVGWKERLDENGNVVYKYHEPAFAMYIPIGVGVKWKFAPRWQLQLAWQHQIYMSNGDGLEGIINQNDPSQFDDSYQMNGSNILNNDIVSTLTLGIVFEFAREKKVCVECQDDDYF